LCSLLLKKKKGGDKTFHSWENEKTSIFMKGERITRRDAAGRRFLFPVPERSFVIDAQDRGERTNWLKEDKRGKKRLKCRDMTQKREIETFLLQGRKEEDTKD